MPKRIDPAVRERVMRMIAEHRSEYATPTELARVIAARERLGVETVRRWVVKAEVDSSFLYSFKGRREPWPLKNLCGTLGDVA
jgi:hypothetical protein